MLYDSVYDFFYGIFNSTTMSGYSSVIMGVDTSLAVWLSHTATITCMILFIVWMILVIRWIFRVFSGLIKV